jgi:hypothetical protein
LKETTNDRKKKKGGNRMKYKVGDKVRIISKEWIDAQEKDVQGVIWNQDGGPIRGFIPEMQKYAGQVAKIVDNVNGSFKLDIGERYFYWDEWMFDLNYAPSDEPLSVKDAIIAMVRDRETLYDKDGYEYWYDEQKMRFSYRHDENKLGDLCRIPFIDFCRRPAKRTRPMTRWEILDWATSEESRGWLVREAGDERWYHPQFLAYPHEAGRYQRARLLPDKSGIDESTVRGFEVEE